MPNSESQHVARPRSPQDFDSYYESQAPWDLGRPQKVFESLLRSGQAAGSFLDVGCGTGEHALLAAELGHASTGVDASARAIEMARQKARTRQLDVSFLCADVLNWSPAQRFDAVLDCGFFHGLTDHDRQVWAETLKGLAADGCRYFMLAFSSDHPGDLGPRRLTVNEIADWFHGLGWTITHTSPRTYERIGHLPAAGILTIAQAPGRSSPPE
ncbi:methyltransferase domain-containing protein [Kribbella sp. NPDC023855]|uniref:class I SAM-dependent methyltransferase n=1 Tax=Kribbella sp. NPDC023855 TaxID=3154698 RepID=UPI00340E5554